MPYPTPALRACALLVLALLPAVAFAADAAAEKVQPSALDGLAFAISVHKPKSGFPAPFANLPVDGHACSFQGGKIVLTMAGVPTIPPLAYQATKRGDIISITCADAVDVIDKANKNAEFGYLTFSGTISDSGKALSGELDWKIGDSKNRKKVSLSCDGLRPAKDAKATK
jgi:hypothetical protein